jgi:hypothetical protein
MERNRFEQIERLYHAALERGPMRAKPSSTKPALLIKTCAAKSQG